MPTPRQFTLDLDGIAVLVTRRRKEGAVIRTYPDGRVTLSAPTWFTKAEARAFLLERQEQILALLARQERPPREKAYREALSRLAEGDRVPIWGRDATVIYRDANQRASAKLEHGSLVLALPTSVQDASEGSRAARRLVLERFLKHELVARIPELARRCEVALGVGAKRWMTRTMSTRWGSCRWETRRITLNVDLATHDPRYLESVAFHEACHLIAHDHGPEFKALMDRVAPGWRELDRALKAEGVRLGRWDAD